MWYEKMALNLCTSTRMCEFDPAVNLENFMYIIRTNGPFLLNGGRLTTSTLFRIIYVFTYICMINQ